MLHAGLDLSRRRLDVHLLDDQGGTVQVTTAPPDADGLRGLARQMAAYRQPVRAAIESMNGARFVHDQLELAGWQVAIADAQKVKGLAPLACKTDRIDAWVLAELCRRDLVPEIWLPTPGVRAERERARFRLHLVRHRTALKNRIHALALIDDFDDQIDACERDLRHLGADHPYVPLLMTAPGIAWVLGYTIAAGQERLRLAEAVEVAGDGVLGAVLGAQVPLEGAEQRAEGGAVHGRTMAQGCVLHALCGHPSGYQTRR
jgi:transposase